MEEVRRVERQERLVKVYRIEKVVLQREMEMVEKVWDQWVGRGRKVWQGWERD